MKTIPLLFQRVRGFRFSGAVCLTVLIAVQSLFIVHLFFDQRNSYYCDEIYSYGLANSYYQPFLESESIYDPAAKNINEWVSGQVHHDYLTVQQEQQFRYDAVWYNQSKDRHPPLYYACLHTLCSLFPEQFSFLFGFGLNLLCFAVTQIFMYRLGKRLFRSGYAALVLCLVTGFSIGLCQMTLFIRMYGMLTMFVVMLLSFHATLIDEDKTDKPLWKLLLPLYFVTLAGCLTQYMFAIIAFLMAVFFCVRYLVQKRWRWLLLYGGTMLAGVLTFFLVYPPAVRQLFLESDAGAGGNFGLQMVNGLNMLFYGAAGLYTSDLLWYAQVLPLLLLIAVVLCLPVVFLFRQSAWVQKKIRWVQAVPKTVQALRWSTVGTWLKGVNPMTFFMLMMLLTVSAAVAYKIRFLDGYVERYYYAVMPMTTAVLVSVLYWLVKWNRLRRCLLTVLCLIPLCSCLSGVYITDWMYYDNTLHLHETLQDKNVLVLTYGTYNYTQYTPFAYEFSLTDHVFFTSLEEYEAYTEAINDLPSDKEFYVMLISYAAEVAENEKGSYIESMYIKGDKLYLTDLFGHFAQQGTPQYVGAYHFMEGDFLLYRCKP